MIELKNKRHWVFDMDGTLTCAMHDFDAMRAKLDLPPGVPILEALASMEPALAEQKRRELNAMELSMAAQATPQPGSNELLDHLQAQGVHLGIVTRNGKQMAEATLEACGLATYFEADSVISRDCCTAKPDPTGIYLLMERWSGQTSHAVMVGDYLFDLQAGHAAGATTVHMDVEGLFLWPEMTDVSVKSLGELHELLT